MNSFQSPARRSPSTATPVMDGTSMMALKDSIDNTLDFQGLSSNAVQAGILKGKVQGLQLELAKVKLDFKDTSERLNNTVLKLNEQKIQNSTLMHQHNSLMAKLSHSENNEKDLEEAAISERRAHAATKAALERSKKLQAELEQTVQHLRDLTSQQNDMAGLATIQDRSQYVNIKEYENLQDSCKRVQDNLLQQIKKSFDHLVNTQEESETTMFISRSSVLSAATDLETKLCHTENVISAIQETMNTFTKKYEEDVNDMLMSLISENKKLWNTISKLQYDIDRANSELATYGKAGDFVHKDKLDYAQKQITLMEDRIAKLNKTIETQNAASREHSEKMRLLLDENVLLNTKVQDITEELSQARSTILSNDNEIDRVGKLNKDFQKQIEELNKAGIRQQTQITSLAEQLHRQQCDYDTETQETVKTLLNERDTAVDNMHKIKSDLDDALGRLAATERELDAQNNYIERYKEEMEQNQASYVKVLQDELVNNRNLYEKEIEELRNELSMKGEELHQAEEELEQEKVNFQAKHVSHQTLDERRKILEKEVQDIGISFKKTEDRLRKMQYELDESLRRNEVIETENAALIIENNKLKNAVANANPSHANILRDKDAQIVSLKQSLHECEKARDKLSEELIHVKTNADSETAMQSLRQRLEKEKEELKRENNRLLTRYQEVQQDNVTLQQAITQLKTRVTSSLQLQQQLEDLQKRLAELPALRQAAEQANRESMLAREEAVQMRREKDEMSKRLEYFLEESRTAVRKDNDLDRLFKEASNQVKRMDEQVDEAAQRSLKISASRSRH